MAVTQSLVIKFSYREDDFELLDSVQDKIEEAVTFHHIGSYEGYELDKAAHTGVFFFSSSDSETLFKNIRPILLESPVTQGATVEMQTGDPAAGTEGVKVIQL